MSEGAILPDTAGWAEWVDDQQKYADLCPITQKKCNAEAKSMDPKDGTWDPKDQKHTC